MKLFTVSGFRVAATLADGSIVRRELGASTLTEAVEMLANMGAKPISISPHFRKNKECLDGWKRGPASEPDDDTDESGELFA